MTKIEDSIVIDAPAAEVFAYASDWRRWPEWFEGLSDVRSTSGVSRGWTGAGTRGLPHRTRWRFETQGQSMKFSYGLDYSLPPPLLGPMLDALFARREWRGIIRKSLSNDSSNNLPGGRTRRRHSRPYSFQPRHNRR